MTFLMLARTFLCSFCGFGSFSKTLLNSAFFWKMSWISLILRSFLKCLINFDFTRSASFFYISYLVIHRSQILTKWSISPRMKFENTTTMSHSIPHCLNMNSATNDSNWRFMTSFWVSACSSNFFGVDIGFSYEPWRFSSCSISAWSELFSIVSLIVLSPIFHSFEPYLILGSWSLFENCLVTDFSGVSRGSCYSSWG